MKRFFRMALLLVALAALFGCHAQPGHSVYLFDQLGPSTQSDQSSETQPNILILTHSAPEGSLVDQAAWMLKETVEAASDSSIQIQIYPEDSLGNLDDGRWYFGNDTVDMRIGAGPNNMVMVTAWLPVLAGCSVDEISQSLQPGQPLWELLCRSDGNTRLLGILPPNARVMTSSLPVEDLTDLSCVTMRTIPNAALDRLVWEALGAKTVELSIQDLYLALQQGQADAQENPLYLIRSYNLDQQQRYLIPTNLKVYLETIYINESVYTRLSQEQQALLEDAVIQTCASMRTVTSQYQEECQDIFLREGIQLRPVSDQERLQLREILLPILDERLPALYGQETCQAVLDTMAQQTH